jgi:hypothetical protein
MRAIKVCLTVLLLALVPACTGNDLDDADSADVLLLINSMDSPSVRASRQSTTSGTCAATGTFCQDNSDCGALDQCIRADVCILEVEDWSVAVTAAPKNSLAEAPYNDIVMVSVDISYDWVNDSLDGIIPPQNIGLGNIAIPTGGQGNVKFPPIPSDPLNITTGTPPTSPFEGATANMTMTFNAVTVEGTQIRQTALRQLLIEICR